MVECSTESFITQNFEVKFSFFFPNECLKQGAANAHELYSGIANGFIRLCDSVSFIFLQITRSDIRPHVKWTVSLVIAGGHLIFIKCLC